MKEVEVRDAAAFFRVQDDVHNRGFNLGPWPEDGGGQDADQAHLTLALHPHAQVPIVLGPGLGGQPVGQLFLDGDGHGLRRGGLGQQVTDQRRGDVVGQIGHQLEMSCGARLPLLVHSVQNSLVDRVLVPQGILAQHGDIFAARQLFRRHLKQMAIQFDRHHRRRSAGQHAGHPSRAGTDFQNHVLGGDRGRLDQQPEQVQVDQKILSVAGMGFQPHFAKTPLEVGDGLSTGGGHDGARGLEEREGDFCGARSPAATSLRGSSSLSPRRRPWPRTWPAGRFRC